MNIQHELMGLGLSAKEAKVFLTTMELGTASAYEIAKKAHLKRTTVYAVLDALVEKKFVATLHKKHATVFTTLNPTHLLALWEDRAHQHAEEVTHIKTLLPFLESIYASSPAKPHIKFYEHVEGVRDLHTEILHDKKVKEIFYITAVGEIEHVLGKKFFERWVTERARRGIKSYGIRNRRSEVDNPVYTKRTEFLRDFRLAPAWMNIPMGIYIFNNKVALFSSARESFALLIESAEFAALMKSLFDAAWKLSEEKKSSS